jgi:hypothetical protein
MNPQQVRGEELQDCFGFLASQPLVESGAGDRLLDADGDLQLFLALMLPRVRLPMRTLGHGRDLLGTSGRAARPPSLQRFR